MKILLTGGAGFIGSNLVRLLVNEKGAEVINLDKLTYAGNTESLADLDRNPNYTFEKVDICDVDALGKVFAKHQPENENDACFLFLVILLHTKHGFHSFKKQKYCY